MSSSFDHHWTFGVFPKNTEGVFLRETGSGDGGSTSVESSVLEEAKRKGKDLYYITLEVSNVHFIYCLSHETVLFV